VSTPGATRISVIVPTRNRPQFVQDALECVLSGLYQSFDVWIMDQTDGATTEDVVRHFKDERLHYVRMPRNGACPARNLGAALAQSELVAFLDDDCCPRQDWLQRIVAGFDASPDLQFIFGALRAPDVDRKQGWYPEFLPDASLEDPRRRRRITTLGAGANMAARKSFLRRIGGFDELLGPSDVTVNSSDTSMCYKVFRSGEKWIADAEIEVIHKNGFRPHAELGRLFAVYAREMGIDYGRFVRRGDTRAAWLFALEQCDLILSATRNVVLLRRPQGLRDAFGRARGFIEGLRLNGRIGYVDGAEFRRMEATRTLDR
jgi:glycosyltransferase involved in cell wall biosynthesis